MLAGFINTPDPIILPAMIEVADQKPILLASDEVVDILKRKIIKKPCLSTRLSIHFVSSGFNPNIRHGEHTSRPDTNFSRKD